MDPHLIEASDPNRHVVAVSVNEGLPFIARIFHRGEWAAQKSITNRLKQVDPGSAEFGRLCRALEDTGPFKTVLVHTGGESGIAELGSAISRYAVLTAEDKRVLDNLSNTVKTCVWGNR